MGLSICSGKSSGEPCKRNYFQRGNESHTSGEEEDTGHDNDSFSLLKYMSFPSFRNLEKVSLKKRAIPEKVRSRGYSLQDKMKDWHESPEVNTAAELQAERYTKIVEDDTMKHLSDTIRTADSIVLKSCDIRNELGRQRHVLSQAESDTSIVENDIHRTSGTLRVMSSMICKPRNVITKKDVNLKSDNKCEGLSTFDRTKYKSSGLSKGTSDELQQTQISAGMGKLDTLMDTIISYQSDIASDLSSQEGRLTRFENRLATVDENINSHCHTIRKIMDKL